MSAREEDPDDLIKPPPQQDSDLQDVLTEHWSSIRSHVARGPVQTRYNFRLRSMDTRALDLRRIFQEQTTAVKVNLSYGFILRHTVSGRYKYYHSSCNCCGRYLDEPSLVTDVDTFEAFLERIHEQDILQWAIAQRPNSDWVCSSVTNVSCFVNRILQHPIGCVGVSLPTYVKRNKVIVALEKDKHGKPYLDNLCLFRCLGLHLCRNAIDVYAEYTDQPAREFRGVTIEELHKVELVFRVNITVYELGEVSAKLVRRSLGKHADTMFLNLYETHLSYIRDMKKFSHSYTCSKCGEALWRYPSWLKRHELTCKGGIRRVYKGGVYHPTPSVFQRLEDEGIHVVDVLRFYPYRATFDFECFFDGKNLPNATDHVEWVARHVPLSVSVASNVPGYEAPRCFVTDGDSNKLVAEMMSHLHAVSDAAFESLKPSYESVLDELKMLKEEWDSAEKECGLEDDENEDDVDGNNRTNPFKKLQDQLSSWLQQLPVIGFNSGKYDLNMIKRFFVPFVLTPCEDQDESCFVIKRQNTFMCFSTNKLRFLDIQNYLAPGVSYDKYLKAYGCSVQKGHFPYEYIDDLQKLEEHSLPPQTAFFSRLKNEGISDTDYALCQEAWRSNRMTTMRDFLVFYNNRDVVPFLECIDQQFAFYQQQNIDMFKDGISVPGLTLLYLFNDLPPNTFFTDFNQTNKDLHHLVKDNILGGPAIIFHRYHEKNVTKIRAGETCRSVVGYDANALYLWALMQDMPCGWYTRRREEKRFQPQQAQLYGQMAAQWLTSVSYTTGRTIRHQSNGREKRVDKLLVDGWCAETRTAYQFHGCYFHGCTDCYEPQETNALNGKTMAKLLEDTKKNTAYLRRHVHVVEMWECEWKRESKPPRRPKWTMTQNEILTAVIDGNLFGIVECDVRVPDNLRGHLAEMQPVFKNTTVTRDDIGPYMRQYAEEHNILTKPRRMLVGSYSGDKILLTTPLLRWYIAHGLVVDHVYQVIEYEAKPCFQHFGESVSAARRAGDTDPDKAIIADTMKLLGNSGYGKTVTNVDRHRDLQYCTEVGTSSLINNKLFRQLEVVTDNAYEVEMSKRVVKYTLPLHIGFFVYQYAKLRMLQFYYDFIDRYF